jgi:heat shock protein HtpX
VGQMRRAIYRPDTELSIRMFLVMFLLAALYLAFLAVLWQVGLDFAFIIIVAVLMLGAQYYYSDKLVLRAMGARVVEPQEAPDLHATVDRLVAMADMPKPRLAIVNSQMPNAFATGRDPNHAVVAVTTGLMRRLDRPEVEAVLAHELSHVKNRDAMIITLASFFATVAFFIMRSGLFYGGMGRGRGRGGGGAIIIVYLAALLVWVISFFLIRALSRYRELAADRGAATITGAPSALASALQKISGDVARIPERDLREAQALNAFFIIPALRGRSFMELLSTHPSLERRLERLSSLQREMEGLGPR